MSTTRGEVRAAAKPIVEGAFIACLFVGVFLAPFHVPQPDGVPVAISGPPAQVRTITTDLERSLPGALDVRAARDGAAARRAIEDRDVYGAIVLGTDRAGRASSERSHPSTCRSSASSSGCWPSAPAWPPCCC